MGAEYRKLLGYLPQDFGFYPDFTAERFLRYMAALKALPKDDAEKRIEELLTMVELKNVRRKKLKTFFRRDASKNWHCPDTFKQSGNSGFG